MLITEKVHDPFIENQVSPHSQEDDCTPIKIETVTTEILTTEHQEAATDTTADAAPDNATYTQDMVDTEVFGQTEEPPVVDDSTTQAMAVDELASADNDTKATSEEARPADNEASSESGKPGVDLSTMKMNDGTEIDLNEVRYLSN
jgi:hypothetical protein